MFVEQKVGPTVPLMAETDDADHLHLAPAADTESESEEYAEDYKPGAGGAQARDGDTPKVVLHADVEAVHNDILSRNRRGRTTTGDGRYPEGRA